MENISDRLTNGIYQRFGMGLIKTFNFILAHDLDDYLDVELNSDLNSELFIELNSDLSVEIFPLP